MGIFGGNDKPVTRLQEWVKLEFKRLCPEPKESQQSFYLAAIEGVRNWAGPLVERPRCGLGLDQVEVNVLVACNAMQMLEVSNYRAWTASKNLLYFQRLLFIRTLVAGFGGAFRDAYYLNPKTHLKWSPFNAKGTEFFQGNAAKRMKSNVYLSSSRMEQALFHHLFPAAVAESEDPMAGLAAIDSFETPPDLENPMVQALRRAVRKSLRKYRFAPGYLMSKWLFEWYPAVLEELDQEGLTTVADDEANQDDKGGGEATAPPKGPSRAPRGDRAMQFATLLRSAIDGNRIQVSCPKAPIHAIKGVPVIIWPGGLDRLAAQFQAQSGEEIKGWLVEKEWVHHENGEPVIQDLVFAGEKAPGGPLVKKASARVIVMTETGRKMLIPERGIADNPTLVTQDQVA